ncbi:methyltransferase domain-containing protein [Streptomyces sp. NPDC005263]|uniref:methyltransferase domain-containing protein n=1 Tax=Streptomyces sp. NPDC005263 TaxID=3364711 RepID=UPI00367DE3B0
MLSTVFPQMISVDLSLRMLQQAHGRSPARVQADASTLPLPDSSVTVIAAIDTLLFPTETARVLAHDGALLWINQLGSDGPLYLNETGERQQRARRTGGITQGMMPMVTEVIQAYGVGDYDPNRLSIWTPPSRTSPLTAVRIAPRLTP